MKRVVVIGAGAAGCFCALQIKRSRPDIAVTILEAGPGPLAKLALTGGGRCNITNDFSLAPLSASIYPRGHRLISRLFHTFGPADAYSWWESEGLPLTVEDSGRVFPACQDARRVVSLLSSALDNAGVEIRCGVKTNSLRSAGGRWVLETVSGRTQECDAVVLACGGTSDQVLRRLLPAEVEVEDTVPSLFTFRIADEGLKSLMGISVPDAALGIQGTSFKADGELLITDWGLSGPAVLRLSSYAARYLSGSQYRCGLSVNWLGWSESEARSFIDAAVRDSAARMVSNVSPGGIPSRLWEYLLGKAGLRQGIRWGELGSRGAARLVAVLTGTELRVEGRAAFKEEFVTCGGVSLSCVDPGSMMARDCPGLFFAGEVLDIDAVTGGYNLQAAWTTGWCAATGVVKYLSGTIDK